MMKPLRIQFSWWFVAFLVALILGAYTRLANGQEEQNLRLELFDSPYMQKLSHGKSGDIRVGIGRVVRDNETTYLDVAPISFGGSLTNAMSNLPEKIYLGVGTRAVQILVTYNTTDLTNSEDAELTVSFNGIETKMVSRRLTPDEALDPGDTNEFSTLDFTWDAPSATNVITNYTLYTGGSSLTYTQSVNLGTNLTYSRTNYPRLTKLYFNLKATDENGLSSDYAGEQFITTD